MKKTKSEKKWKVHYDSHADVLYFVLKEGVVDETTEAAPGVNLEFTHDKKLMGVEILDASRVLKPAIQSIGHAARK